MDEVPFRKTALHYVTGCASVNVPKPKDLGLLRDH